jgi:hypothetical protein
VAKWLQPISTLSLSNLHIYLQQPLAEDEKIPIPQDIFDWMSRNPSFFESPELELSAEQLATLFRVSRDERAWSAQVPFVFAIESEAPASGREDVFHSTWDNNISRIFRLILSDAESIRNSNRNCSTALKRPDYGLLLKGHCVLRGKEKGSDPVGDPKQELVEKLIWQYSPLSYILGLL